jgi:hypothetical protein
MRLSQRGYDEFDLIDYNTVQTVGRQRRYRETRCIHIHGHIKSQDDSLLGLLLDHGSGGDMPVDFQRAAWRYVP